jgi:hypothetical protein
MKREPGMVDFSDVAPLNCAGPDWYAKSNGSPVNETGSFGMPGIKAKVDWILKCEIRNGSVSLLTHWVADEVRYSAFR